MRRQQTLLGREPQVRSVHANVVCPSCQRSKARTGSWAERFGCLFLFLPAVAGVGDLLDA
eukprot:12140367-Alexandrium_andersonii.AAC.1